MTASASQDKRLRARAEAVIPGGMYGHQAVGLLPDDYPQFFSRAEGARLWDADGREFLDLMCAYGPNLFGYGHPEINAAFVRQMEIGDTLTGPTELIVELAEAFVDMVTHADWAMFCKNGTDATTMAMVTARAHTRRKTIVLAKGAYHGAAPWCTPRPGGVTPQDKANQRYCTYNDIASLEAAVAAAGDDLAAVFAAPVKHDAFVDQAAPDPAYARRARELCDQTGALLVVDDVRAGLRIARDDCSALVGGRRAAGSVDLGQVHRQRPSDLGPAGLGRGPRGGALDLRHRLVLVPGRPDGGGASDPEPCARSHRLPGAPERARPALARWPGRARGRGRPASGCARPAR